MKYNLLLMLIAFISLVACVDDQEVDQSGYKLVWSDEFNEDGLPDTTKWSYDTDGNSWGWGNNESQWYTASEPKNAIVKNGNLHIIALKESINGKEFSSARLISKGKGDWLYGKAEIRAKLPGSRGIWPAIWMLPTDDAYGIWPASGEIDIMEHVGYLPDSVFASTHCQSYYFKIGTQKTKGTYLPTAGSQFHTYSMEWNPEEINMFCDSVKYFTFKNEHKTFKEWPFDKRFYMILNVAVGGHWGGVKGIDSTAFPQEMVIDYVRYYQK